MPTVEKAGLASQPFCSIYIYLCFQQKQALVIGGRERGRWWSSARVASKRTKEQGKRSRHSKCHIVESSLQSREHKRHHPSLPARQQRVPSIARKVQISLVNSYQKSYISIITLGLFSACTFLSSWSWFSESEFSVMTVISCLCSCWGRPLPLTVRSGLGCIFLVVAVSSKWGLHNGHGRRTSDHIPLKLKHDEWRQIS